MKLKKYMGFTLAEVMIIMAVLAVLLAAFAPVFTVRYKNASLDSIWTKVNNDDNNDIYNNQLSDILPAQSFIGMQPGNETDVYKYLRGEGSTNLYSKLVIRASNKLDALSFGGEKQKQMLFRYGNTAEGSIVGALFAGNGNILLGGQYKNIQDTDKAYNTAFGYNALNSLTSGKNNTAYGYGAASALTEGSYNTFIGYDTGAKVTSGIGNTLIGYDISKGKESVSNYNTIIGHYSGAGLGEANTIVGDHAATSDIGTGNTAVGFSVLRGTSAGNYNTAVGHQAMSYKGSESGSVGNNNTAIGANSCQYLVGGSNKTCIGYNTGSAGGSFKDNDKYKHLVDDDLERIYIGYTSSGSAMGLLEVHNFKKYAGFTFASSGLTYGSDSGDAAVVIDGNLIVRGQSFLTVDNHFYEGKSLVGMRSTHVSGASIDGLAGWDGNEKNIKVTGRKNRQHHKFGGRTSCICARSCVNAKNNGVTSYDWNTRYTSSDNESNGSRWKGGYIDKSTGHLCNPNTNDHDSNNVEISKAHGLDPSQSCCPDIASDIRLKDLETTFDDGLEAIKLLNVFNFTFKDDEEQQPQVGVIAQDLKHVFANSVFKDKRGYYQIRWDEMLYSAINAVKTLNTKIESLAARVSKDQARIATLKKDNAKLEKQVDKLADELTVLENKSK